jgi:hypothetical protein
MAANAPAAILGIDRPGDRIALDPDTQAVTGVWLDGRRAWERAAGAPPA